MKPIRNLSALLHETLNLTDHIDTSAAAFSSRANLWMTKRTAMP